MLINCFFAITLEPLGKFLAWDDPYDPLYVLLLKMLVPVTGVIVVLLAFSLVAVVVTKQLAKLFSGKLSRVLNKLTWNQLRRAALGNDTLGELSLGASDAPLWINANFKPLPRDLAEEISACADQAASQALTKFRDVLHVLATKDGQPGGLDWCADYLTWNELIHTCYFNVERFGKLVAYSVSQGSGFRVSAQLANDADFPLIEAWSKELRFPTSG